MQSPNVSIKPNQWSDMVKDFCFCAYAFYLDKTAAHKPWGKDLLPTGTLRAGSDTGAHH